MDTEYKLINNLIADFDVKSQSIISQEVHKNMDFKAMLFGFDTGQELSEHTASKPAIIHFLEGEATVTLGGDTIEAKAGTWIHMPAKLPHSISAKSPTKMLLYLLF